MARRAQRLWLAFAFLVSLIAADNLLWRLASWIASFTFVRVTGDLRRDLFRHLTGHSPSYFADRLPGMLTSRITATSNAMFTIENMFVWNVLPPCVATVGGDRVPHDRQPADGGRAAASSAASWCSPCSGSPRAGKPLHHDFADKAAVVDGEMVDVIGNMPLVRAFCGLPREHRRFDPTVERELTARRRSLLYLETAAHPARAGHGRAHHRPARLGDRALAARRDLDRATWCWSARSACRCCMRRAIWRWRWSM